MSKKVLLIADDDEMSRKIISRFLKGDYDVLEAPNGKVALETLRTTPVDALLLDIIMPEMDGLQVLEHLRTASELDHVGVLVATSTKEKTERSALSLGADDVVSKPYDPLVIKKRLTNIMATKELERQQKLLEGGEPDVMLVSKMRDVAKQSQALCGTLKKYTAIINANKDNFKLVAEMTAEINREAELFSSQIESQQ